MYGVAVNILEFYAWHCCLMKWFVYNCSDMQAGDESFTAKRCIFICCICCRLHINVYVSALVMIKEKVIKNISSEVTNWFAVWNDDRKFHHTAGQSCLPFLHMQCVVKISPCRASLARSICLA